MPDVNNEFRARFYAEVRETCPVHDPVELAALAFNDRKNGHGFLEQATALHTSGVLSVVEAFRMFRIAAQVYYPAMVHAVDLAHREAIIPSPFVPGNFRQ